MSKKYICLVTTLALLTLSGCTAVDSVKNFFSSDETESASSVPQQQQEVPAPRQDNAVSEENRSQWKLRYE